MRRNSSGDERLRDLERRASAGDYDAAVELAYAGKEARDPLAYFKGLWFSFKASPSKRDRWRADSPEEALRDVARDWGVPFSLTSTSGGPSRSFWAPHVAVKTALAGRGSYVRVRPRTDGEWEGRVEQPPAPSGRSEYRGHYLVTPLERDTLHQVPGALPVPVPVSQVSLHDTRSPTLFVDDGDLWFTGGYAGIGAGYGDTLEVYTSSPPPRSWRDAKDAGVPDPEDAPDPHTETLTWVGDKDGQGWEMAQDSGRDLSYVHDRYLLAFGRIDGPDPATTYRVRVPVFDVPRPDDVGERGLETGLSRLK